VEIRTAREIEDRLPKDKILELYLNQIYLGDGVYGVVTAAEHYFGKSVLDVTPAEAAVLIGLAKNPEGYNPNRNPDRAKVRRDLVLDMLADAKLLTPAEAAAAKQQAVETVEDDEGPSSWGTNAYYLSAVWRELRDLYPNPSERAGMRVFTGLDQEAQKAAADALVSEIHSVEHGALGRFGGKPAPAELPRSKGDSPYLQGMVVAMDAQTGLVTTLMGGRDYDHSEFDRAFQAKRQPGSSFKPIVYVTAMAAGLRASEMIPTDPIRLAQQGSQDWEPGDHVSAATLTVRDALVYSSNTASVRIGERAGISRVIQQAHAMGISTDLPNYPSIFLGAGDVIPAELVAAYATFGNGGHTIKPFFISRIEDADGRVLYQKQPDEGQNAVDPRLGFIVLDMMRDVVRRGTGTKAMISGIPMAGKTGTTNDSKDLWFIGLTPKRVAGVWVGFDQPRTVVHDIAGGDVAAPVWARFMAVASRNDRGMGDWQAPSGVEQVAVDLQTGMRWSPACGSQSRTEWFLAGTEPAGECATYGPGWIQNANGQWEYRGQYDSLSYGPTYGYNGYNAAPDTGRTIFWRDSTGEYERRRQAQLDSLDRVWGAAHAQPPQPTRTDSDQPLGTQPPPAQPAGTPRPSEPARPSDAMTPTAGPGRTAAPIEPPTTAPAAPTAKPQAASGDAAEPEPRPAAPDSTGVR
jgi:penicillin-binding protein 1A